MRLPRGLRWWELLPEVLLTVGLGLFLLLETSAATSAFKSRTAIVLMVLTGAAWLLGRFVLVRYTRWPALRLAVFTIAALGVLRVVVYPAYDNKTVVEELTVVAAAATAPAPPSLATTSLAEPAVTVPPATPRSPEPVALRSSAIHGIDHRASGTAVVYRLADGSHVVGLEDIDIQPGPDYDVYLVPGADREDTDAGIRLDDLRGNKGTQYYPVPAGTDAGSGGWTVLVWCQTFDVPVAGATPS